MRWIVIVSMGGLVACDLVQGSSDVAESAVLPAPAPVQTSEFPETAEVGATLPDAMLPPPVGAGSSLGTTVVSLGDPAEGGMWLKTPLVRSERPGQVRYRGVVVAVTLKPLDMEVGAGSQISVRAMQALGASLTDLVEVTVEAT